MQKTLLLVLGTLLTAFGAQAQLADSKWTGSIMAPSETTVALQFRTDTVGVFTADGDLLESMSYHVSQDTLLLTKRSGHSPCDLSVTGRYLWKISGDNLTITPVADQCAARLEAWTKQPFVRSRN